MLLTVNYLLFISWVLCATWGIFAEQMFTELIEFEYWAIFRWTAFPRYSLYSAWHLQHWAQISSTEYNLCIRCIGDVFQSFDVHELQIRPRISMLIRYWMIMKLQLSIMWILWALLIVSLYSNILIKIRRNPVCGEKRNMQSILWNLPLIVNSCRSSKVYQLFHFKHRSRTHSIRSLQIIINNNVTHILMLQFLLHRFLFLRYLLQRFCCLDFCCSEFVGHIFVAQILLLWFLLHKFLLLRFYCSDICCTYFPCKDFVAQIFIPLFIPLWPFRTYTWGSKNNFYSTYWNLHLIVPTT